MESSTAMTVAGLLVAYLILHLTVWVAFKRDPLFYAIHGAIYLYAVIFMIRSATRVGIVNAVELMGSTLASTRARFVAI